MKLSKLCPYLLLGAMLLGGCGAASGDSSVPASETQASTSEEAQKSVPEIYKDITDNVALISPVEMQDEFIANYYGIDPDVLEEYVFEMSEDATSAETVVIMKVKDAADVENIKNALGVVIDEKRAEMENYLPEQFEIVDKSQVESKDNYVWLVISNNRDAILELIEKDI